MKISGARLKVWLFALFVAVPLIEIALFIQVGGAIGLWPTLAVVVLTALVGTYLMRQQGMSTLGNLQNSLAGGSNPTTHIAHGAFILVAGMLLLTPGFFTDAIGFVLLIPAARSRLIAAIAERMQSHVTVAGMHPGPAHDDEVVDADYETVEPKATNRPAGSSGWTKHPD